VTAAAEARAPGNSLLAVAWATFQPRTESLATALEGKTFFVSSPLPRIAAPLRYALAAIRTWGILSRESPARVLAVTPPVFVPLLCWFWCRLHRRQLLIDCHTGTLRSGKWGWADPLHRAVMRRASATLLHIEEMRALAASWGARALLLPDDLPHPEDAAPTPATQDPTVLVAGSFDGNEPVAAVVEAARLLPGVQFRLTGDPRLLAPALRKSAPENVIFTGFLPYPNFLGELTACHLVAAFSTEPEIMNRAAFEAVGLGRPLVLSDLPGLRHRFAGAAIFAENTPEEMAAAVRQGLDDRLELEERSRSLAVQLRAERDRAMSQLKQLLEVQEGSCAQA
jgi:glycosyltransferase involved in cell wall biosynthesis